MPKRHTQNLCEELNQIMAHLGKTSTKGLKKGFSPHSPDGAALLQRCWRVGILREFGAKGFRFSCWERIMPFKLHSKGRRHIPRQRHRVTNWREYDRIALWAINRPPPWQE